MQITIPHTQLPKPGKMNCYKHESLRILLANVDGTIYAIEDKCSHEDWPLSNGALKGDCVECPLHGSRFNLQTGKPLEEPATHAVKTYRVQQDATGIIVVLG